MTASESLSPAGYERDNPSLAIARARKGPYFYLVDAALRIVATRLESDAETSWRLPPSIAAAAGAVIAAGPLPAGESAVALVRPGLVLRVVQLATTGDPLYALFLEPYQQRDLIRAAARRYELTARETDVLGLMLLGEPTSGMAARLCIAETTVAQHVKNLGAKIGVTTRRAIVGAVLHAI